jgi:hypothetical protein
MAPESLDGKTYSSSTVSHEMGHNVDVGHQGAASQPGERLNRPDFGAGLEGADTTNVKAHTGDAAKRATGSTGTSAHSEGEGVSVKADPKDSTAHEAAHTVQQRSSGIEKTDIKRGTGSSLHSEGVVHRDLEARNVVGDPSGNGSGGGRAQDYNSSRSNTTTSVGPETDTSGGGGDEAGGGRAKDYNSSRSNTSSSMDVSGDDSGGGSDSGGTKAQDYNSSRSNNESVVDTGGEGGTGGGGETEGKGGTRGLEARKSANESSAAGTLRQ